MGKNQTDYQEIRYMFHNISFHLNTLLQLLSLIVIKNRHDRLNTLNIYLSIIIKIIYIYDIKYDTNIRQMLYPWFQIIMASSFTGLLFEWYGCGCGKTID